jgi:hypothetical protein
MMKKSNQQGQFQIPCTVVTPKQSLNGATQSLVFSAITMTDALFKPGDKGTITITFGDYGCSDCSPDASWSQIGNHSNDSTPSMNLGFIDPPYTSFILDGKTYTAPSTATRNYCGQTGPESCTSGWIPGATVIHEFGHALGMLHEHQNNLQSSNHITLNDSQVIAYYNCIGMGQSGAATNVLDTYSCSPGQTCNYAGTKFDPDSIMLYYLPSSWIEGCSPYPSLTDCSAMLGSSQSCSKNPTKPNFKLSAEDIGWLQQQYPLTTTDPPVLTVKFVDPNPEPWKVAWVKKIITETYGPILGVKWIFESDNILGTVSKTASGTTVSGTTASGTTVSGTTASGTTASGTVSGTVSGTDANVPGTTLSLKNLLLAILLPILFVFVITIIGIYIFS